MSGIVQVTNFPSRPATDGGTSREEALARFLASRGAHRLVVQDECFRGARSQRFGRLRRLMSEIRAQDRELVVLSYPAYPFFWQHRVTPYFAMSVLFSWMLRHEADRRGFRIAIDVMDLPLFQHADLGFRLEMSAKRLRWFDSFVFHRADRLWVCSGSIARTIAHEYGIVESKLTVALNGYAAARDPQPHDPSAPVRFAYAGSLNPERGMGEVIEAFLQSGARAELHLCGPYGDWIRRTYSSPYVIYHGSLSDEQAAQRLSMCDVGLIPYPERGYYHLAFATKLPFYLGLGMPVLCSNARETAMHVTRLGIGICASTGDFASAFSSIASDPGQIEQWRAGVMECREQFLWNGIYSRALEETLGASPVRKERRAA